MASARMASAAVAAAVVAGATASASPAQPTEQGAPAQMQVAMELTASSTVWKPLPPAVLGEQLSVGYRLMGQITGAATDRGDSVPRGNSSTGAAAGPNTGSTPQHSVGTVGTDGQAGATVDSGPRANAIADAIDNGFIDATMLVRRGVTPVLEALGFVGRQICVGLNFVESLTASAVFNGTDVLRGELSIWQGLGGVIADVGPALLWAYVDETTIFVGPYIIVIERPPSNRPLRWDDAYPPAKGYPLTLPDRDRPEVGTVQDALPDNGTGDEAPEPDLTEPTPTDAGADTRTTRGGLFAQWKAKKAEWSEARAERSEARAERSEAKKDKRAERQARFQSSRKAIAAADSSE